MYFYESCRENILKLINSEISEVTYTIRETNQESTRKNRVFFCRVIPSTPQSSQQYHYGNVYRNNILNIDQKV